MERSEASTCEMDRTYAFAPSFFTAAAAPGESACVAPLASFVAPASFTAAPREASPLACERETSCSLETATP
jgi:hypothetical protein